MGKMYKSQISPTLMIDILSANRIAKKLFKSERFSSELMNKLIYDYRMNFLTSKQTKRQKRVSELVLGFLNSMHQYNLDKYDSYYGNETGDGPEA